MKILKGYIFSRPFFNERAPQHVQNIINKDYCKKKGFNFLMSATEYAYKNSTFILLELIEELDDYDGIIFYSVLQLPKDVKVQEFLFKKIVKKKKELHFGSVMSIKMALSSIQFCNAPLPFFVTTILTRFQSILQMNESINR